MHILAGAIRTVTAPVSKKILLSMFLLYTFNRLFKDPKAAILRLELVMVGTELLVPVLINKDDR
jgi:hypothetical protein